MRLYKVGMVLVVVVLPLACIGDDSSNENDSGPLMDASVSRSDAGTILDGGVVVPLPMDAGRMADAGERADAGVLPDSGAVIDGGSTIDAGLGDDRCFDIRTTTDGGATCGTTGSWIAANQVGTNLTSVEASAVNGTLFVVRQRASDVEWFRIPAAGPLERRVLAMPHVSSFAAGSSRQLVTWAANFQGYAQVLDDSGNILGSTIDLSSIFLLSVTDGQRLFAIERRQNTFVVNEVAGDGTSVLEVAHLDVTSLGGTSGGGVTGFAAAATTHAIGLAIAWGSAQTGSTITFAHIPLDGAAAKLLRVDDCRLGLSSSLPSIASDGTRFAIAYDSHASWEGWGVPNTDVAVRIFDGASSEWTSPPLLVGTNFSVFSGSRVAVVSATDGFVLLMTAVDGDGDQSVDSNFIAAIDEQGQLRGSTNLETMQGVTGSLDVTGLKFVSDGETAFVVGPSFVPGSFSSRDFLSAQVTCSGP